MTILKTTEIKPTIFNIMVKENDLGEVIITKNDLGEIKSTKRFVRIDTNVNGEIQETTILVPSKFIHQSKNNLDKFSIGIVPTFDYKIFNTNLQVNGQDLINWFLQK